MARNLTASDRKSLIRLASTLPAGSDERKAILAGLKKTAASYFDMFFKEKRLPYRVFEVTDSQGISHIIPNEAVIEAIKATTGREKAKIQETIRRIDFMNGDVNDYLEHLARGLAEQYSGALRFASSKRQAFSSKDDEKAPYEKGGFVYLDSTHTYTDEADAKKHADAMKGAKVKGVDGVAVKRDGKKVMVSLKIKGDLASVKKDAARLREVAFSHAFEKMQG